MRKVYKSFIEAFLNTINQRNIIALSISDLLYLANKMVKRHERFYPSDWKALNNKFLNTPQDLTDNELKIIYAYADAYISKKEEIFEKIENSESRDEYNKQMKIFEMINGIAKPIDVLEEKEETGKDKTQNTLSLLNSILGKVTSALPKRLEKEDKKEIKEADYVVLDDDE